MTARNIQNIYLVTQDMDAACRFYERVLGQPIKFRDGSNWAQFKVGGSNFALCSPEEAARGARAAVVVFETDDLHAAAQRVRDAGGKVLGARDMGGHGSVATFIDPENHHFQFFARPAPSDTFQP